MDECDPKELEPEVSIKAQALKQSPTCPPETILPIPDELKEKKGTIAGQEVETYAVKPLRIYNHACEASCPEDAYGDVVRIEENLFTDTIYFSQVASIKQAVLEYIAKHELEAVISEKWHEGSLTKTWLHRNTGMAVSQATALLALLKPAQDKADKLACSKAESMLQCYWCSRKQIARCPDEHMAPTGSYNGHDAVFEYGVDACAVKSYISQEDADRKAALLAESMLDCFYVNDPCTATCETRPYRPEGATEPVPNDTTPIYPGKSLRVGNYTIKAGMFISYVSKEDANTLACDAAYSMLNCWYPSYEIQAACDDENARNCSLNPVYPPNQEADIINQKAGQRVTIPAGFFSSDISIEEATLLAEALAETLLECCYINEEIVVECDVETVVTDGCEEQEIHADPTKGQTKVTVPAGSFLSSTSQEEANLFAMQSTEGQLQCIYCNMRIMPTCVPDWVIQAVESGELTLPLDRETISAGGHSIKTRLLPPEATLGAEAGTYCSTDANQAYRMATAASRTSTGLECIYINDEIVVTCAGTDRYNPSMEVRGGVLYYREKPDTLEPYYFYSVYDPSSCISPASSPPAHQYITVPAGLFSGPEKNLLDQEAFQFAESSLMCLWTNPLSYAECGHAEKAADMCSPWWFGNQLPGGQYMLTPFSNGLGNPVMLAPGTITMRGYGDDERSIFLMLSRQIKEMITSMLVCVYGNEIQTAICNDTYEKYEMSPPTETELGWEKWEIREAMNMGVVPAFAVTAASLYDANEAAQMMAESMAACDENTIITYMCLDNPPTPTPTPSPTPEPIPIPPMQGDGCFMDCPYYCEKSPAPAALNNDLRMLALNAAPQIAADALIEMKINDINAKLSLL